MRHRRRDRQRRRHDLWREALRVAGQELALDLHGDEQLRRATSRMCLQALRAAEHALLDDVSESALQNAELELEQAWLAVRQWHDSEDERWKRGRATERPQPTGAAHLLTAPALAEQTYEVMEHTDQGLEVNLQKIYQRAGENPARQLVARLLRVLTAEGDASEITLAELLELSDSDLAYVLEAIALDRNLWPVAAKPTWLRTAAALRQRLVRPTDPDGPPEQ